MLEIQRKTIEIIKRDVSAYNKFHKNNKRNALEEIQNYLEETNNMLKKKRLRATVKKNILYKEHNYSCTITVNENLKKRTDLEFFKAVRKAFKRLGIPYTFYPETHSDGTSFHLHGFITVNEKNKYLLNIKFNKKGNPMMKWGKIVYTMDYLEKNVGFAYIQKFDGDLKSINYIVKYATKGNQYKLFSSREKSRVKEIIDKTYEFFGPYTDNIFINSPKDELEEDTEERDWDPSWF